VIRRGFKCRAKLSLIGHSLFFSFLNQAMKKLKICKTIKKIFMKKCSWSQGNNVTFFIRRLITIKSFFPNVFKFTKIVQGYYKLIQAKKDRKRLLNVCEISSNFAVFKFYKILRVQWRHLECCKPHLSFANKLCNFQDNIFLPRLPRTDKA